MNSRLFRYWTIWTWIILRIRSSKMGYCDWGSTIDLISSLEFKSRVQFRWFFSSLAQNSTYGIYSSFMNTHFNTDFSILSSNQTIHFGGQPSFQPQFIFKLKSLTISVAVLLSRFSLFRKKTVVRAVFKVQSQLPC